MKDAHIPLQPGEPVTQTVRSGSLAFFFSQEKLVQKSSPGSRHATEEASRAAAASRSPPLPRPISGIAERWPT